MSLSEQLKKDIIDYVVNEDIILYGLNNCDDIRRLERYQDLIKEKIERILNERNPIRIMLEKINREVCGSFCQNLSRHYATLQRNIILLHNNMAASDMDKILLNDENAIREFVNNSAGVESIIKYIYRVCQRNENGIDLYFPEVEEKVKEILYNFYMEEDISNLI